MSHLKNIFKSLVVLAFLLSAACGNPGSGRVSPKQAEVNSLKTRQDLDRLEGKLAVYEEALNKYEECALEKSNEECISLSGDVRTAALELSK